MTRHFDFSDDTMVKAISQATEELRVHEDAYELIIRRYIEFSDDILTQIKSRIDRNNNDDRAVVFKCRSALGVLKATLTAGLLKAAILQVFEYHAAINEMAEHFAESPHPDPMVLNILSALAKGRLQKQKEAAENAQQIRSRLLDMWRQFPDRNLTWIRKKLASEGVHSLATIRRYSAGLKRLV